MREDLVIFDPIPVSLVYMGDSITAGQNVESPHRWTDLVSDRLTRKYLDTPVNLLLLVRGISGETSRQGLERFPADVQSHEPDIMTLQFGLNDCNCWITDRGLSRVSELAYRANLIEMIARARRFGASNIILSSNHPTLRHKILVSGESLETRRKRYNEIVRKVAEETNVAFVDMERLFGHFRESELEEMLLEYPDQLHLSRKGHDYYANQIYPVIERAVEESVCSKKEVRDAKI